MKTKHIKHLLLPHSFHHRKAFAINEVGFAVYAFLFLLIASAFTIVHHTNPSILGFATNITTSDIVSYTNQERLKYGQKPVVLNEQLSKAAEEKARDMIAKNYWAHFGPNGEKPWDFMQRSGYTYITAGENLARNFNDSNAVVTAWMNSPTHKENLLSDSYTDIGIAVVNGTLLGEETTLVVQMFGKPYNQVAHLPVKAATDTRVLENVLPKATASLKPSLSAKPTPLESEETPIATTATFAVVSPSGEAVVHVPQPGPVAVAGIGGVNPKIIFHNVSVVFLLFIIILLVFDTLIIRRRNVSRIATHSFAHVSVISLVLLAILIAEAGSIL